LYIFRRWCPASRSESESGRVKEYKALSMFATLNSFQKKLQIHGLI
jgi:hypothetical protein